MLKNQSLNVERITFAQSDFRSIRVPRSKPLRINDSVLKVDFLKRHEMVANCLMARDSFVGIVINFSLFALCVEETVFEFLIFFQKAFFPKATTLFYNLVILAHRHQLNW